MACLNAVGGDKGYRDFDVENMEPKAPSSTRVAANSSGSSGKGRRCCSLPVLLASAALVCSLVALACGIYAAAVVRRPGKLSASDEGVFLTTNPRSREAVNLYRVRNLPVPVCSCHEPYLVQPSAAVHDWDAGAAATALRSDDPR
jgi:hypothetical protein